METVVWRASNVVISCGAIRGEAGGASGTQEKEKKQATKGGSEKARLGEKCPPAAPASVTNARKISLAPLPFLSARSFVPAPLRFLWFPDSKSGTDPEDALLSIGSGGGLDAKIPVIGNYLEDGGKKDDIPSSVQGSDDGVEDGNVVNLGSYLGEFPQGWSDASGSEGSEDEAGTFEDGKAGKRWFQTIINVNFLKKGTKIEVKVPAPQILENEASSSDVEGRIPSISDRGVEKLEEAVARAACSLKDAGLCAGCAAESENYVADVPASQLASLEVPHVDVTHDFDSFSKFLSEVPLTELKIIEQSSFLSSLAYVIPQIKAGELSRYYRMLFVISSVDIKAEALAKEKAEALAEEKAAAAAKSEYDRTDAGSNAKKIFRPGSRLSPATAYALAAAATSFLRQQKDSQASGEETADRNATKSGDPESTEGTETVDSGFAEAFDDIEAHASEGGSQLDDSSSDMPAFMRPVTSVVSAEKDTKQEVANNLRSLHTCPCEWFACDDKDHPATRSFTIQGSESFASWQANLLFEPIQFESSDLGVMVHRGIYAAAIGLYDQILPHVVEHLNRYGDRAKFRFTGHSLGGSLAILLTLMLNIRGVVKSTSLLPVYTFGAPYIMCGGDYLLKKLGLPLSHVQYIVMHRDIVPRAFACNYPDHVAEVLRRVNVLFRDYTCLTRQRLLYAPMGQLMVLQPDHQQAPPHPLLPSGTGLYLIRHQSNHEPSFKSDCNQEGLPSRAIQVRAAQRAFLNQPHPLEIISDPGAYGPEGSIAKHHDPRSYVKALNSVLRQENRKWRRVQRERRRQLWWPIVNADTANAVSRGANSGVEEERGTPKAITSQGMSGPSGLSHFVSDTATGRATFPVSVSSSRNLTGRFSRYQSLIASRHMQMGLVLFLAVKLFIEEGFGVVVA